MTSRETILGRCRRSARAGDLARPCVRLWFREMLEPTGLPRAEIDNGVKPVHAGLLLGRQMGVAKINGEQACLAAAQPLTESLPRKKKA